MATQIAWLVLCLAAPPEIELRDSATTTLYVRTIPPGAQVLVDGTPLGKSNSIFIVSPGRCKITVELEGYQAETRRVEVVAEEVTRLVLELRKASDGGGGKTSSKQEQASNSAQGAAAALEYLARADVPVVVRTAMTTVLRQHPTQTRWAGHAGTSLFGVAVKHLPSGDNRQRAVPALLELSQMLAVQEMLKAKVLLDRYAEAGLTDATTLSQAIGNATGRLQVVGTAKGVTHQAAVRGDYSVAYVMAEESALAAYLLNPAALDEVRAAYRDVMHRQARELMQRSDWKNALLLWQHLHKLKLVSQQLYIDATRCFQQLGQEDDALRVLTEAMNAFRKASAPDFFEQVGDVAVTMKSDQAQALAEKAYRMASEQLRDSVSPAPPRTENNIQR